MNLSPKSLRVSLGFLIVGWAVVGAAYWNALAVPFIWDDHVLIEENPALTGSSAKLFDAGFWVLPHRTSANAYYRPLVLATFVVDSQLAKGMPASFHRTNLLLHLLVCALVFFWARRLGAEPWLALMAMLLFGVFPRLTESVTWISGRTDLMAALGAAGALLLYRAGSGGLPWRLASALVLGLGLLSKEVAAAGFLGMIALEWSSSAGRREIDWRKHLTALVPAFAVLVLYFILRSRAGVSLGGGTSLSLFERMASISQALGEYLWIVCTPHFPHLYIGTLGELNWMRVALGLPVLGVLGRMAWFLWKRKLSVEVASIAVLSIGALLPVLHIIPIPLRAVAADRFFYLPWLGFSVLLSTQWKRVPVAMQKPAIAALVVLIASFVWATHQRNYEWSDELRLWESTAREMPPLNGLAEFEIGNTLGARGRSEEAIEHYQRSYAIELEFVSRHPNYAMPLSLLSNLGLVLSERGEFAEAISIFERLLVLAPDVALYRLHYAGGLARALEFEAADREFQKALELYPEYGEAMRMRKQTQYAARMWEELPPIDSDEALEIRASRGMVYFMVGRVGEANRIWIEIVSSSEVTPELIKQAGQILQQQRRVFGENDGTRALANALRKQQGI